MAGIWTDYWKIITPAKQKTIYASDNLSDVSLNNFSWYTKIMKGASGRFQKYALYRKMDTDVFVSRALDTIAEEMTSYDEKADLPFEIVYQAELGKEVPDHISILVNSALRNWCDRNNIAANYFDIARMAIKYGDCFFKKTSDFKDWEFIKPENVAGVELNPVTKEIIRYQVKNSDDLAIRSSQNVTMELIPADAMLHFSMSSLVAVDAPFGESVLLPTVEAYRQLSLLEESVIIYRIVRAPERRVFFIDVGNMPPQRVKAHLESVKNDVKQKRMPSEAGGHEQIDSIYNPIGMIEDYFFPVTANGRGGRVETLPGGENLGNINDLNYFQTRFLQGLRIPSSYMRGSNEAGSLINDGQVGVAYIEELQFTNYVKRLQNKLEVTFDKHFKAFLKAAELKVNPKLFKIKLLSPQNFTIYKQNKIDSELVNTFNNVKEIPFISKRFALKRYLGWSDSDLQANEVLIKQELNIPEFGLADGLSDVRMIYDDKWYGARPEIKVSDKIDNYLEATGSLDGEAAESVPTEGEDLGSEAGSEESGSEDTSGADATAGEADTGTEASAADAGAADTKPSAEPAEEPDLTEPKA